MLQDIRIVKGARRIVLLAKGDKFTVVRRSSDCGQVYNAMPKDGPVGGGRVVRDLRHCRGRVRRPLVQPELCAEHLPPPRRRSGRDGGGGM